jgi:hypothetical protein
MRNKMKKLEVISMAYDHQGYIQTLRDDFLKGAFGEFMCRQISLAIGERDHWSNEVRTLLAQAGSMLDPETKIKGFKDRDLANKEAVHDVLRILQTKVTFARSKVSNYYPKKMPKIQKLKFDNEEEFKKMLDEFLPSFSKYLKP